MSWHVLVDVEATGALPPEELAGALEAHPLVRAVSVNAPPAPLPGWRRTLASLVRARPSSVLLEVAADGRREAERVGKAAVEDALARVGLEARLRASAFRR